MKVGNRLYMLKTNAFYGARLCVITVLVVMLIYTIIVTDKMNIICSSILLFLLPMILDYFSQNPVNERNKKRKEKLIWTSSFASTITFCVLALTGSKEVEIGFSWWKTILSFVFIFYICMAIFEWIGYSSKEEMDHRKKLQKAGEKLIKKKQKKEAQKSQSNPASASQPSETS